MISNLTSTGKVLAAGGVGYKLGEAVHPKLSNVGAVLGVMATASKIGERSSRLLKNFINYYDKDKNK